MKAIVALAILLIACGSVAQEPAETITPAVDRTRQAGEPGIDFIRRAMGTDWARANACGDPVRARACLAGIEQVVIALCESRMQAETR